ncbi:muellerian-inhibiting factor [Oncorhynchus kisutch]|uniref:Anti-mullerian hormone n=1 Tax=Oncorhynchus kisutch TaxID=8019 RepID=E7EEK9_ONCKI|nr:muellerian-inhibiting factor [Oncorhynchus kisutch]ADV40928.1 anti-mullerian hormone [Oncorhynchus kisutch]
MRLWCIFCLILLLPSTMVTLPHQGRLSDSLLGRCQEDPTPDHPGTGPGDNCSVEVGKGLGENALTVKETINSHPSTLHLPGDTPCFGRIPSHGEVIEDMFSALREGWGQESDLRKEDLTRFGICSHSDGAPVPALSTLAEEAKKEKHGLHVWHPTKELMEGEVEGWGLVLTFHLPRPPLSNIKPILLLAFRNPRTGALGAITFTSHSLQPYKQTVCISEGTQFLILTGKQPEGKSQLKWRFNVDTKTPETGQKLSELRGILIGDGTRSDVSVIPLVLFSTNRGTDERVTEKLSPSPAPSGTYTFLCELQKFLSDVVPPQTQSQPWAASVPLYSLDSLPPLSLGVSSSETLLARLLNSSAPTLFSFPTQGSVLQGHRGELSLQPALLEVLRQRLEEVLVQMRVEEVGKAGMDRLRRLQELSVLPKEGEEAPAGVGSPSETQYRALLLLKALQTVVGAWDVERGQRATRAGQKGPGNLHLCRLHSLTVSLEKYLLSPPEATIYNCQGVCSFPLTNGNNHAILLNSQIQSGLALERSPCCVPVDYEDLKVVELDEHGTNICYKPNMVAKECGCR